MIEAPGRLPAGEVVALAAAGRKLAAVRVLVAGLARGGKAQKRPVRILDLDLPALHGGDMLRVVALRAAQVRMPALQRIPGLAMIELVLHRRPADDVEIHAVMLGMAPCAVDVPFCQVRDPAMIAGAPRDALPDFRVAIQAAQPGAARPEDMAVGAADGTA